MLGALDLGEVARIAQHEAPCLAGHVEGHQPFLGVATAAAGVVGPAFPLRLLAGQHTFDHGAVALLDVCATDLADGAADHGDAAAVSDQPIAAEGTVVWLPAFGLVRVFRIVAPNGDTSHWVTNDLGMAPGVNRLR